MNTQSLWTYEGSVPFTDLGTAALGADVTYVHRFRLGNGLRLLLLVDKSAPVLSYFTWFRVGSRHERPGKTGLAHLFEHLMFNETEGLKAGEFDRKLEENGAESNAATWLDWTYYYESLPKDRFALAVKLESERMARLVLREPQVVSEKEVVANERRMRVDDDVEGTANEILYKTAFTKHPYHWPTIGWMDDIQNFTPEDCEAFYKTYYAPNNATVVVVGDVREADVLEKIRAAYGAIPASVLPEEDTTPEPHQLEAREVTMKKPTASEKLLLGYRGPALGDADHVTLSVLNEVLFGGRACRMYRELVVNRELCTDLRGWVSTFRDPGLYEVYYTARPGVCGEDILPIAEAELARARDEVVTEEELARAKARLELGLLQSLETMSGKAEQIGFYDTVLGDPAAAFRRLEAYRRVTAGELRTAARRYLNNEARTMIRVLPEGDSAPASGAEEAAQ
ncbi:Protease precursor [Labilithrix luteola]|uniref:Protease n=1 Tax=Labilithrix luteola TaxID=1391654 RepID=A0A0K1QAV7_9BACT|nr:Protease precursor [Labilithrix luteola]